MSELLASDPQPSVVGAGFYRWLREVPTLCSGPPDPDLRTVFETFLCHEADLLDQRRYETWYDLFTDDGLYWVPIGDEADDPARAVSVAFDDHRRLGEWMSRNTALRRALLLKVVAAAP